MLFIKLALRNLGRNARRTRTIGLIIAGILCLMTIGNAILDGTEKGVRRAFIESFTGDLSVSAATGAEFSLFGDDSPVVGGFSSIPTMPQGAQVAKDLASRPQVAQAVAIVCGQAALEVGSYRQAVNVFGVDGSDYFKAFAALSIAKGLPIDGRRPGIMITEARAAAIAQATGKAPELGDPMQLTEVSSEDSRSGAPLWWASSATRSRTRRSTPSSSWTPRPCAPSWACRSGSRRGRLPE